MSSFVSQTKPIAPRLADEKGFLVKNFCVGLTLLDDEFVKNALLGNIIWKQVFSQDDHLTHKYRSKVQIQSKYEPGYLFESVKDSRSQLKNNRLTTNNHQLVNVVNKNDVNNNEIGDLNSYSNGYLNGDLNGLNDYYQINHLKNQLNNNPHSDQFVSAPTVLKPKSLNESPVVTNEQQSTDLFGASKRSSERSSPDGSSDASRDLKPLRRQTSLKQELNLSNLTNILNILKEMNTGQLDAQPESNVPIKCLSCSYTTTSVQNLLLHSSYHRNVCEFCNKQFESVYSYFNHFGFHLKQLQHLCSSELEFRCGHCYAMFKQQSHLIDHFNQFYTQFDESVVFGEKIFKFRCKICGLVDVTFRSFQDHYSKHHTQVKCSFCNRWFSSLEQVEQHVLLNHRSFANNYECEFCQQKFTFKTILEHHLQSRHCIVQETNGRKCYLCDHEFGDDDLDLVIEHLANHCEMHIYNCDTCEFR